MICFRIHIRTIHTFPNTHVHPFTFTHTWTCTGYIHKPKLNIFVVCVSTGARRYHGFARTQTNNSLGSDKPSRVTDIANSSAARPDSPSQLLRPESSIHNISCASSVDEANNDSDGSFSEDGSEDSIDVASQPERTMDYNKDGEHSEGKLRCSSAIGNGNHSKSDSGCKPYFDHIVKRHPDDDSDGEEGHWAQQTQQSVGCHRGGETRTTETYGGMTTTDCHTSTARGKQRRLGGSSEEGGDRDVIKTDSLNVSSLKLSRLKGRDRCRLGFTYDSNAQVAVEHPISPLSVNSGKIIDVHISVKSVREHNTTFDSEGFQLTPCDDHTVEPLKRFSRDFSKEDVDDCLDIDVLDSNRIPSADIFQVLDALNLSTSAKKPPIPKGEKSKVRRVQSAGYKRQTVNSTRDKRPFEKDAKCPKPPSGKLARKRKETNKSFHNPANLNTTVTAPTLIEKAEDLTRHVRESLPGYFTEQYKKILDEQNENGKSVNEAKMDGAPSGSLVLVTQERTSVGRELNREKELRNNDQSVVTVGSKKYSRYSQKPNERPDSENAKSLDDGQDDHSEDERTSRSSLTGVFVTKDGKSDLRGFDDVEDSSGVETMSCVTDSSCFKNFGDTINQSNCDNAGARSSGHEDFYPDGQHYECGEEIDDDDDGGDCGYVDDAEEDFSNLEVVAKPMPLSESRFVHYCVR